jgi:hypothetical protein
MVECSDRLHLKVAESVLRPLKRFAVEPDLTELTIRPPGRGCWVHVTVSRVAGAFTWSAAEIDRSGIPLPDGRRWSAEESLDTAEAAYWQAVDVIGADRRPATARR